MEIGVWGDSIAYGSCDTEALGWVGRMRKSLRVDDYVGVYNRGVSGDTTRELLQRFAVEAASIQPNVVIFEIGINDSRYPKGEDTNLVPIDDFKENMRRLLEEATRYTDRLYVVSATNVDPGMETLPGIRFKNEDIERYNAVLREIAGTHDSVYIDVFDVLDPRTDLVDGIHPNAGGYQKLFTTISSQLDLK